MHHYLMKFGVKSELLTAEQRSLLKGNWSEDSGEMETAIEQPATDLEPRYHRWCMAAPGLLTWVMINKYADYLPLYRLEQMRHADSCRWHARPWPTGWAERLATLGIPPGETAARAARHPSR